MNVFALAATVAWAVTGPAYGGGVLLCNEYGCRSSPYFPPPIIGVAPPVVYMPANPPQMNTPKQMYGNAPRLRLWNGEAPPPGYSGPVAGPPPPPARQTRTYRENAPQRGPRPDVQVPDPQADEIEGDIVEFCNQHPTEGFCNKLNDYLDKHGRKR